MYSYYNYPYYPNYYNEDANTPEYSQTDMFYPYMQYPFSSPSVNQLQPILSNRPEVIRITAFKELTGFPNYGNPSGNADILYTGNTGRWTLSIPPFLLVPGNLRAQLVIRAVLDDHSAVPESNYSATISINGAVVHRGRLPLQHGRPAGQMFTNWRDLTFNIPRLARNNTIQIVNTSNTGESDWIGLDWMEIRFTPR